MECQDYCITTKGKEGKKVEDRMFCSGNKAKLCAEETKDSNDEEKNSLMVAKHKADDDVDQIHVYNKLFCQRDLGQIKR